ncbi:MAG: thioesterase family protein [Acidimicrobiales bacterium]
MVDALFVPADGGLFHPTELARGPWSELALHGGPVAALLARVAEAAGVAASSSVQMQPVRLTVELLRPIPLAPMSATAAAVRTGRKVQWVEAECTTADGTPLARARMVRIRSDKVDVTMDHQPTAARPDPPAAGHSPTASLATSDYPAFHSEGVEHRFVAGRFDVVGPATDWIRLRVPVVPGEEPSPLQRVAAAADFGNGVAAPARFEELRFINADLSIHLHRLPVGEWVCLDSVMWLSDRGVAQAESELHDEQGRIGRSLQSLLLER